MPDWAAIRMEYVTGDIALRPLADKHGVSFNTLKARVKKEGWAESRREYRLSLGGNIDPPKGPRPKRRVNTTRDTTNVSDTTSDTTEDFVVQEFESTGDYIPLPEFVASESARDRTARLFKASEQALDYALLMMSRCKYPKDIKAITGALKDIKEIQMIKSALDEREQLARIERLKAETKEEKKAEPIEVVFVGRTEGAAR